MRSAGTWPSSASSRPRAAMARPIANASRLINQQQFTGDGCAAPKELFCVRGEATGALKGSVCLNRDLLNSVGRHGKDRRSFHHRGSCPPRRPRRRHNERGVAYNLARSRTERCACSGTEDGPHHASRPVSHKWPPVRFGGWPAFLVILLSTGPSQGGQNCSDRLLPIGAGCRGFMKGGQLG